MLDVNIRLGCTVCFVASERRVRSEQNTYVGISWRPSTDHQTTKIGYSADFGTVFCILNQGYLWNMSITTKILVDFDRLFVTPTMSRGRADGAGWVERFLSGVQ